MCYLNALYYTDPQLEEVAPFSIGCDEDEHCSSDLVFPAAASELLPPNPRLEQQAKFGNQTGIVKINENVFLNLVILYIIFKIDPIIFIFFSVKINKSQNLLFQTGSSAAHQKSSTPNSS